MPPVCWRPLNFKLSLVDFFCLACRMQFYLHLTLPGCMPTHLNLIANSTRKMKVWTWRPSERKNTVWWPWYWYSLGASSGSGRSLPLPLIPRPCSHENPVWESGLGGHQRGRTRYGDHDIDIPCEQVPALGALSPFPSPLTPVPMKTPYESLDLEAIREEEHGTVTMTLIYPASKFRLWALSPPSPHPSPLFPWKPRGSLLAGYVLIGHWKMAYLRDWLLKKSYLV